MKKPKSNLSTLGILISVDIEGFLNWWKTNTISKLIVSLLFVMIFGLIAILIYAGGMTFLRPLLEYGEYGRLTASYLFEASILVTIWLGVGSSFISTYEYLTAGSAETDLLMTYPIRPIVIVIKLMIRSILTSLLWSLIVFLPLGIVVAELFGRGVDTVSVLNLVLIVALVISFCTAAGGLLAFMIADIKKLKSMLLSFILGGSYILATLFLIRFLLPPQLSQLETPDDNFNQIYAGLPLVRYQLPTYVLTQQLLGQKTDIYVWIVVGLVAILTLVIAYQAISFLRIRRKLSSVGEMNETHSPNGLLYFRFPLMIKDVLSVTRSQRELGYGFFLIFLVLSFFYFLQARVSGRGDQTGIYMYSLAWFLFYTIAYLLRLVFPLMAREGRTVWFLFTQSLNNSSIWLQKSLAGLILAVPLLVIALSIWPSILGVKMMGAVLAFSLISVSLGNVWPNFEAGDNPDVVSTSAMGLSTLVILSFISYLVIRFWI